MKTNKAIKGGESLPFADLKGKFMHDPDMDIDQSELGMCGTFVKSERTLKREEHWKIIDALSELNCKEKKPVQPNEKNLKVQGAFDIFFEKLKYVPSGVNVITEKTKQSDRVIFSIDIRRQGFKHVKFFGNEWMTITFGNPDGTIDHEESYFPEDLPDEQRATEIMERIYKFLEY